MEKIKNLFINKNDISKAIICYPNKKSEIHEIVFTGYNWFEEIKNHDNYYIDFDMYSNVIGNLFEENETFEIEQVYLNKLQHFSNKIHSNIKWIIRGNHGIICVFENTNILNHFKIRKSLWKWFKKRNLKLYDIYKKNQ